MQSSPAPSSHCPTSDWLDRNAYYNFILKWLKRTVARCSYLSLRLILVNSTRPASIGRVSSPAEIIRRQSSYVWSVTGILKALRVQEAFRSHFGKLELKYFSWLHQWLVERSASTSVEPFLLLSWDVKFKERKVFQQCKVHATGYSWRTLTEPWFLWLYWQTEPGFSSPPLWGCVEAETEK